MESKTITLAKFYSRKERDEKLAEYRENHPNFLIYNNHRQTKYEIIYEIKGQAPVDVVEEYLKAKESKENAPIQTIIDLLKVELEPLRVMYHEKTQEWANSDFDRMEKIASMSRESFFEAHKRYVKYSEREIKSHERTGWMVYGRDGYKEVEDKVGYWTADFGYYSACKEEVAKSREVFLKKAEDNAEAHYQSSIVKLAGRISEKNLDVSKIKAETKYSKVDVNIETLLSDGEKSVRAWTIIASGEIQRPHYRYLVK